MKATVIAILLIISMFVAALAAPSGFIYTLYLWGSVGLNLGPAVWQGFVLFVQMALVGVISVVLGTILGFTSRTKSTKW